MSENQLRRLADELSAELSLYRNLARDVADALARFTQREPDHFELRGVGSILHDVYHGAENICQQIAKEVDTSIPMGANWHRLLLEQMSQPLPKKRPIVLQAETVTRLDQYRAFRHVFRNIYGTELDWSLMKPLLENGVSVIEIFAADMEQFITFLRMISGDEIN